MRWLWLAPVLLAGCPKKLAGADAVRTLAPPPGVVEYDRYTVAGPFDLPVLRHRETWVGPEARGELTLYEVETVDATDGASDLLETVVVFYGPTGYGFLGTLDEDGSLVAWEPPQVVLPANPVVGETWSATHTKAGRVSERSCELMRAEHCEGGVVSVCESRREQSVVVLRDHFCPGQGWSGFEALQQVGSQPPLRMWSQEVLRDGVALPELPSQE